MMPCGTILRASNLSRNRNRSFRDLARDESTRAKERVCNVERAVPPHPDPLPWGEGATLGRLTAQLAARRVQGVTAGTFSWNPLPKGEEAASAVSLDEPPVFPVPIKLEASALCLALPGAATQGRGCHRERHKSAATMVERAPGVAAVHPARA